MRFHYKGFWIDPTPDRVSGDYVAHGRVVADDAAPGVESSGIVDLIDLGRFAEESLAMEHAVDQAVKWIDSQEETPVKISANRRDNVGR